MKYIQDDPRLERYLESWAGQKSLVVGSFWFWAAGTQMQRSLLGLYRSLLYQILKGRKGSCRVAFPEWHANFSHEDPTIEMLTRAMNNVLASEQNVTTNFFFLIDGLDEYETDSVGKSQLAQYMLELAMLPHVRLVLASRPEPAFEFAFRKCPALRLEALTEADIRTYVKTSLHS